MWTDEEKIEVASRLGVSIEVKQLLKKEVKKLEGEGRKVSMQKIANRILYEGLINKR